MGVHAGQRLVEVKRREARLGSAKVLRVYHTIVDLVLVFVEIRYRPAHFVPDRLSLRVSCHLLALLVDVHALDVTFKVSQRVALIEDLVKLGYSLSDLIMLGLVDERHH